MGGSPSRTDEDVAGLEVTVDDILRVEVAHA